MVKRVLRWSLPVVLLIEAALVWSGGLGVGGAILVVAGIEVVVLIVGVGEVLVVFRRYRNGRRAGLGAWEALEGGMALVVPRPVARLMVSEPRMFACLARWASGRASLGEGEFGYGKGSPLGMLLVMVVLATPVEVVFWELLVPWAWLRWTLLALSVYSVLWLFGLYASRITLPHRLEEGGLRLRHGVLAEAFVPYAEVERVEKRRRKSPNDGDGLQSSPDGDAAYLATNGRVDLALELKNSLTVRGFLRDAASVGTIHVAADEPDKMLRELRQRLEGARAPVTG